MNKRIISAMCVVLLAACTDKDERSEQKSSSSAQNADDASALNIPQNKPPTAAQMEALSVTRGKAQVWIKQSGKALEVRFESAAVNFFGFNRAPKSQPEKNIVQLYTNQISDAVNWMTLSAEAQCTFEKSTPSFIAESDKHYAEFNWQGNGVCEKPQKLSDVTFDLLKQHPSIKEFTVHWQLKGKSGQKTISAEQPKVTF